MSPKGKMFVYKRNGRKQTIHYGKITARIKEQSRDLDMDWIDPPAITARVICGLFSGITSIELDNLVAENAATMTTVHGDYAILATRIAVTSLHKRTKEKFSEVIADLHNTVDPCTKKKRPVISDRSFKIIKKNARTLDSVIKHSRDFDYNYFGFKTLERSYLLKIQDKIVERPQHMLMRVSVGIHDDDIEKVIETYELLSERYFTHGSPTLRASCLARSQLSSCFLLTMTDDSIEGVCEAMRKCALISKCSGGIGLNVHCIRAKGTKIAYAGEATGVVPMLQCFNQVARYVDQGGTQRPGAIAAYLEPWHADVFEFLKMKNGADPEERTKVLFPALWICDLFMQRVSENKQWSLMCPRESPGLADVWGNEFEDLYTKYEKEGRYKRQIPARDLWSVILLSQIEAGTPHILYKDQCNKKSNQKNVGMIKGGNLCTEIVQYSSPNEVAVCTLASIAVNKFVNVATKTFDFAKLLQVAKIVTRNLDKAIDMNYYPTPETERSNRRHRPIGIGIQGLADAFLLMRYPFESAEAQSLNIQIFETLYYATLEASAEIAAKKGPYPSYEGSPASKGILQYEMWDVTPTDLWNWAELKEKISDHGLRNSLVVAAMPTVSTSLILGNNNSIEPYTSNIYTRHVTSGEFRVVNSHLFKDLNDRKLWDEEMENDIIGNNGSIQSIDRIPADLKILYKTAWEISYNAVLKMAADRGPFIDQSQSLNVHMTNPSMEELSSMHMKGWKMGLKTGLYYLRTKPSAKSPRCNGDEWNPKRIRTVTSS